jgi:beta-galactosidase
MAAAKAHGAPLDYVGEEDWFDRYPFLIVPAYQLVDAALVEKWRRYAEGGGHLILTCRTGQKDKNGQLPEAPWAGMIAPLIGAEVEMFDGLLADGRGRVRMDGAGYEWNRWADVLKPREGTEAVAAYADQFYAGKPAVVTRRLGRGTVTYIGVDTLDGRLEKDVLRKVYGRAGAEIENYPPGVYVEWRDGFFVAVHYSSAAFVVPVRPGSAIIVGSNPLPPAGVLVWREP